MFYIGIVENNIDTKKLGRLQVRIIGIHSDNRNEPSKLDTYQPTEHLPWAMPAFPISNSSIDGISDFSTIERGTRVWIFFADPHKQHPVYFAVCPFILDAMPDFERGFSDPSKSLPTEEFKDESSISRLARNEKIDKTIVKDKNDNRTEWEMSGANITEPESAYAAVYPFNRVIETAGGIVIEYDSTPNNKRVHIYHPSGSYEEINNDGDRVKKSVGNDWDIVLGDKIAYIAGNLSIKVDGNCTIEAEGNTTINSDGNCIINSTGLTQINSTSMQINSETTISIAGEGVLNIGSTGIVNITGSIIKLN